MSDDPFLTLQRNISVTIDEANAIAYAMMTLMLVAYKQKDTEVVWRLNKIRDDVTAAFSPEEWEQYSRMVDQASNKGEH